MEGTTKNRQQSDKYGTLKSLITSLVLNLGNSLPFKKRGEKIVKDTRKTNQTVLQMYVCIVIIITVNKNRESIWTTIALLKKVVPDKLTSILTIPLLQPMALTLRGLLGNPRNSKRFSVTTSSKTLIIVMNSIAQRKVSTWLIFPSCRRTIITMRVITQLRDPFKANKFLGRILLTLNRIIRNQLLSTSNTWKAVGARCHGRCHICVSSSWITLVPANTWRQNRKGSWWAGAPNVISIDSLRRALSL